ncbi:S-layer homology domain-containing protein [Peptoniphilus vaginalis]|uniref:S-layer homology domain-containing protein n=1 Tax=Peptoniphilus vaginalis TaxID=1756987 RepID=UPI0023F6FC65|nr:S-layer homology domain-containing protein [Peptoniphilus vaginalis]
MEKNSIFSKLVLYLLVLTMSISILPITCFANSSEKSLKFNDVSENYWGKNSIIKLADKGIVKGYSDGTFKPYKDITRGEFISLVNKSFGFSKKSSVKFKDVLSDSWCYDAISVAVGEGYTNGYPDGTFRPNAEMSRAEAATFLTRIFMKTNSEKVESRVDFKDNLPAWAKDSINYVVEKGYMKGYPDGTFQANKSITRAEVCSLIDNAEADIRDFRVKNSKTNEDINKKLEKDKKENNVDGYKSSHSNNKSSSNNKGTINIENESKENNNEDTKESEHSVTPSNPNKSEDSSNPLSMVQVDKNFFIFDVKDSDNKDAIKNILKEKYLSSDKYFIGKIFKDNSKVLLYADNIKIKCKKDTNQLPETISGIYMGKENEFVPYDEKNNNIDITLFVGNVKLDKPFETSKIVLGFKGNNVNGGLDLYNSTKIINGLNFNLEKAPKESMVYDSAISQSSKNGKNAISDLEIINNTFDFGKNTANAKNAIKIMSTLNQGFLKINNNIIKGTGADINSKQYNSSAISINKATGNDTLTEIIGNKISDYAYHGIGVTVKENASLTVEDNILDNIGQNGIDITLFGKGKEINIKDNIISKYGSKEIMSKEKFSDPLEKPSNKFEVGFGIGYIEKSVYGVKINNQYYNDKNKLLKDLFMVNTIQEKELNDKNQGVLNCTPIYFKYESWFKNPIKELNKEYSRLQKEDLVIVKDDDNDLTIPSENIKSKIIKSLKIVGNGSGKVKINPSLIISDNLTIDLPNANLQNNANIDKEKVNILKIRDNDYSNFSIKPEFTEITFKDATELPIEISSIKNKSGEDVTKEKSRIKDNIKVFVNDKETNDFKVNDEEDKVILGENLLNNILENCIVKLEYTDVQNNISKLQKTFYISVKNKSSMQGDFVNNKATIYERFAPEEGLKVKINLVKNSKGESVDVSRINLAKGLKIKLSYNNLRENDFSVDGNIITIKKSFLDKISAPVYGSSHNLEIHFTDTDNKILNAKETLKVEFLNNSTVTVTPLSTLTYTQKKAPQAGIVFEITGIKNSKGVELKKNEIDLERCVDIEPFPVDWKDDTLERLNDGTFRFNRKYLDINKSKNTISIKKEYLDKLEINDKDTEFGTKQIIVKYIDQKSGINFRSDKFIIHIKKALNPLSEDAKITSEKYLVSDSTIKSGSELISNRTKVADFIKNILKENPRQVVRVYEKSYINNGRLDAGNVYKYKKNYEDISNEDYLVVTAENGEKVGVYKIITEDVPSKPLMSIKNNSVISKLGTTFIELVENTTLDNLKNSIELTEGTSIKVLDDKGLETNNIKEGYKFILEKGETREEREIRIKYAKRTYRALIVANSDYGNSKLNLVGPKNDKDLMKKVFENQEIDSNRFENIVVAENLKKEEFLEKIKESFKGANDNDVSYLYYSGHGNNINGISYICTVDSAKDKESQIKAWISVDELRKALDQVPGTKVLIFDSCNAGGFIGKKVDAVTSPTPNSSRSSREFNESIQRAFSTSLVQDRSIGYLTTNEYKVLTASSEDEYSFEDKKEAVGKFTKVLSQVAGINGKISGDNDSDGKISLEEAYEYLEDNVVYTSHIQAFPRNDKFTLFEIGSKREALSNKTSISSINNVNGKQNLKIIIKGDQRLIESGEFKITDDVSVGEFLSYIEKGDNNQSLLIKNKDGGIKIDRDNLVLGDKLVVKAENGDEIEYNIIFEQKELALKFKDNAFNIVLGQGIFGNKISSGSKDLDTNLTVEEFLKYIENRDSFKSIKVYSGIMYEPKLSNEKLETGDYILVQVKEGAGQKRYTLIVKNANN